MKKLVLLILLISACYSNVFSQIEFGIKAGLNSTDYTKEGISIITNGQENFNLFVQEANYGVHFGLYSRISLFGIFIEPSALFNSSSVTYRIEDFSEDGISHLFKNERYNALDIPVVAGFKFLIFRVYAGPVAHLHINSSSEFFDLDGYEQRFKEATYGFQAGVGLDLYKIRIQLSVEGNLSKFGEHLTFNGHPYSFDSRPSRVLGTVGIKF